MKIKWDANFCIEDSTVQLGEAYICLVEYVNVNTKSNVTYMITDVSEQVIAKSITKTYDRTFANEFEVYDQLLSEYEGSEIV